MLICSIESLSKSVTIGLPPLKRLLYVSVGSGCSCIGLACLKVGHMRISFPSTPTSSRPCWTYIFADECAGPRILLMRPANEFHHWFSLPSTASLSNLITTPGANHARLILCEAMLFPRWSVSPFHYHLDLRKFWLLTASSRDALLVVDKILRQRSLPIQVVRLKSKLLWNVPGSDIILRRQKSDRHRNAKNMVNANIQALKAIV